MSSDLIANIVQHGKDSSSVSFQRLVAVHSKESADGTVVGLQVISEATASNISSTQIHAKEHLSKTWRNGRRAALIVQQHLNGISTYDDFDGLDDFEAPMMMLSDSSVVGGPDFQGLDQRKGIVRSFEKVDFRFPRNGQSLWSDDIASLQLKSLEHTSTQYLHFPKPMITEQGSIVSGLQAYDSIDIVSGMCLFAKNISHSCTDGKLDVAKLDLSGPSLYEMESIAKSSTAIADLVVTVLSRNRALGSVVAVRINLDMPSYHYYHFVDDKVQTGDCTPEQALQWLKLVETRHDQVSAVFETAVRHACALRGEDDINLNATPRAGIVMDCIKEALEAGHSPNIDTIKERLNEDALWREFYAIIPEAQKANDFSALNYMFYVFRVVEPALRGNREDMQSSFHRDDSLDLRKQLPEHFDGTLSSSKLMDFDTDVIVPAYISAVSALQANKFAAVDGMVLESALETDLSFWPTAQQFEEDSNTNDDVESATLMSELILGTPVMQLDTGSVVQTSTKTMNIVGLSSPNRLTVWEAERTSSNCMVDSTFYPIGPDVTDEILSCDATQDISADASSSCMTTALQYDEEDCPAMETTAEVQFVETEEESSACMRGADIFDDNISDGPTFYEEASHATMACTSEVESWCNETVFKDDLGPGINGTCPLMMSVLLLSENQSSNSMLDAAMVVDTITGEVNPEADELASANCMADADAHVVNTTTDEVELHSSEDVCHNFMVGTDMSLEPIHGDVEASAHCMLLADDHLQETSGDETALVASQDASHNIMSATDVEAEDAYHEFDSPTNASSNCMLDVPMLSESTETEGTVSHFTMLTISREAESAACMTEALKAPQFKPIRSRSSPDSDMWVFGAPSHDNSNSTSGTDAKSEGWTKLSTSSKSSTKSTKPQVLIIAIDSIKEVKLYTKARQLIKKLRASQTSFTYPTLIEAYIMERVYANGNKGGEDLYSTDPSPRLPVLVRETEGLDVDEMMGRVDVEGKDLVRILYGKEIAGNMGRWFGDVGL